MEKKTKIPKIQIPLGMRDWKGQDMIQLKQLENAWLDTLALSGFSEIRTPMLESVDLFVRSVGEFSDIVTKEMFVFDDMVLRPEGTASIMRSFLEDPQSGPKYYSYFAPFFRKERPQKGRFRQFTQYGCEIIGENAPQAEITVLNLLNEFYKKNNIKFRFEINFLAEEQGLKLYAEALKSYYQSNFDKLSDQSKRRFENEAFLRILDSKEDYELSRNAPTVLDYLNEAETKQWKLILSLLDSLKIPYKINNLLVRGLDYYEGFVFEVVDESNTLGSQNALGGGGRYNKLSIQLGSTEKISAFGFGGGAERLLYQLQFEEMTPSARIGILSTEDIIPGLMALKSKLQTDQIVIDVNFDPSIGFKKMFRRFDKLKMNYVVIVGKSELENNKVKIKNLSTGNEVELDKVYSDLDLGDFLTV